MVHSQIGRIHASLRYYYVSTFPHNFVHNLSLINAKLNSYTKPDSHNENRTKELSLNKYYRYVWSTYVFYFSYGKLLNTIKLRK